MDIRPAQDGPHSSISIAQDGEWYYGDQAIIHPGVLAAFYPALHCDAQGRHYLLLDGDSCPVAVCDAAFVAVALRGDARRGFELILNSGQRFKLDPASLSLGPNRAFYTRNPQGLKVRFSRAAHALLAQAIIETDAGYALEIEGRLYGIS